jgi:purine-binding chemotaxis protein CheW
MTNDKRGSDERGSDERGELLQLVSFNIGQEEFGVDILRVQEINKMTKVTRVPNAPDFVEGIINLRGTVVPIIDLRTRLNMEKKEEDKDTRIVVVELGGDTIGFVVDAVSEVLRISRDVTEPPPPIVAGVRSRFITAVAKLEDRLLILLDLEAIFSDEEREELRAFDGE